MAITKIPNFSEIILMCFVCEKCGFKDAEVKPGGKIQPKGQITTLHVTEETAAYVILYWISLHVYIHLSSISIYSLADSQAHTKNYAHLRNARATGERDYDRSGLLISECQGGI